jgi:hypothetical protein
MKCSPPRHPSDAHQAATTYAFCVSAVHEQHHQQAGQHDRTDQQSRRWDAKRDQIDEHRQPQSGQSPALAVHDDPFPCQVTFEVLLPSLCADSVRHRRVVGPL